jgi:hypothetical protein
MCLKVKNFWRRVYRKEKIFHVNPRQIKKIQQLPRLIVTRVKIKRDNPRKKKSTLAYIDIKNY